MKSWLAFAGVVALVALAYHFRHAVRTAVELCGLAGFSLAVILAGCAVIPLLPYGRPRTEARSRLGSRRPSASGRLERERPEPAGFDGPADRITTSRPGAGPACYSGDPAGRPAPWPDEMPGYPEPGVPVMETGPAEPDPMWDHFAEGHDLTER